jgi:glycosyltransferase involved in cell wall biosynthesis
MRTIFLAPELFTDNGGIPRILRIYLKALCDLCAQGDKVRFIALNDETADTRDLSRYTGPSLDAWRTCQRQRTKFIKATLKLARSSDHILCGHVAQLPVALAAKILNPRLTYDVIAHGIEVWRPFTVPERLALRYCRNVICISEATRRQMLNFIKMDERKMPILPNALDPFFTIASTPPPPPPQPPVICAVARLSKFDVYKGIDTLIRALPQIRRTIPGTRLCIMGKGDDAKRLRDLADHLHLGTAVEMPGFVSDEALQENIRNCSLFALPSKKEGFGLVFIEAMAQGRPCLGARAGGIPEVISPETGVLVEYGQITEIADACIAAISRNWDTERILEHARSFSYEHFRERLAAITKPNSVR